MSIFKFAIVISKTSIFTLTLADREFADAFERAKEFADGLHVYPVAL